MQKRPSDYFQPHPSVQQPVHPPQPSHQIAHQPSSEQQEIEN